LDFLQNQLTIGERKILTRKEEAELSERIQKDSKDIIKIINELMNGKEIKENRKIELAIKISKIENIESEIDTLIGINSPDKEEKIKLLRRLVGITKDFIEARNSLVEHNLGLAIHNVIENFPRGYNSRNNTNKMLFEDLNQEAIIGIIRGAELFDSSLGNKFSTFVKFWIKVMIDNYKLDKQKIIRVPSVTKKKTVKVIRASNELFEKLGENPSLEQLSEKLGMPVEDVTELLQIITNTSDVVSLETPSGEREEGNDLNNIIASDEENNPAQIIERKEFDNKLSEEINQVLFFTLDSREAKVLRLRYGIGNDEPMTLEEVGNELGFTRERARQLQNQALGKLRKTKTAEKLEQYR